MWKASYKETIWSLLLTETSHRWTPRICMAWLCGPCRQRPLHVGTLHRPRSLGFSETLTGLSRAVDSVKMFHSLLSFRSVFSQLSLHDPQPSSNQATLSPCIMSHLFWDCVPWKAEIEGYWGRGAVPGHNRHSTNI